MYQKDQITITGTAQAQNGENLAKQPINILVKGLNGQQKFSAVTDDNGNYSLDVNTANLYAGCYDIYAGAFGSFGEKQDSFEIVGMKVVRDSTFIWDIKNNTSYSGCFTIENLSSIALTDVEIKVLNAPENFKFTVDAPSTLQANGILEVNYTVTADGLTKDGDYSLTDGWQKIAFQVTSNENVTVDFNGYFFSSSEYGELQFNVDRITANQNSETEKYYEFSITNVGRGDTGKITIQLPASNLMRLISDDTIDNLASGETATVTVAVNANGYDNLILNAPYTGSLSVSAENANAKSLGFDFVFTTGQTGSITASVSDEYTFYAENAPMLEGAKITIYNAYTNQVVSTAYTDSNGNVRFDNLAEGVYLLKFSADKHQKAQKLVTVKNGEVQNLDVMLNLSTVSYSYVVVPVTGTDEYEIVLSSDFQTNIPAPVITVDMPTDFTDVEVGQTRFFNITLTNHGLINAEGLELFFPSYDEYVFTILSDLPELITPNSSYSITVKLERVATESGNTQNSASAGESDCLKDDMGVLWYWICGQDRKWHHQSVALDLRGCDWESPFPTDPDDEDPESKKPLLDIEEYLRRRQYFRWDVNFPTLPEITIPTPRGTSSQGCEPCQNALLNTIVKCVSKLVYDRIKEVIEVVDWVAAGFDLDDCTQSSIDCLKSTLEMEDLDDGLDTADNCASALVDCKIVGKQAFKKVVKRITLIITVVRRLYDCWQEYGRQMEACRQYSSNSYMNDAGALRETKYSNVIIDNYDIALELVKHYGTMFYYPFVPELLDGMEYDEEAFGDWFCTLMEAIASSSEGGKTIVESELMTLRTDAVAKGVPETLVNTFIDYWERTIDYHERGIFSENDVPLGENTLFLSKERMQQYIDAVESYQSLRSQYNIDDVFQFFKTSLCDIVEYSEALQNGVCAKITLEFSQSVMMSREAFEGTLTVTNNDSSPLENFVFTANVFNDDGLDVSNLFKIVYTGEDGFETTVSGADTLLSLNGNSTGTISVIYLPGREVAVNGKENYHFSGEISYISPNGENIEIDLSPVTLTVMPSPILALEYFVERDVYGDDPFTDGIEASIPAEIAVLVKNTGLGDAQEFKMSGFTPRIVDNEKGLLQNYRMSDAALNGKTNDIGILDVNMGTIKAHSSSVAQWWYVSNLQGHYTNYEVSANYLTFTYSDRYGNTHVVPINDNEYGLIESADIHELIRSIDAGDDELPDFLVDDLADASDTPDMLYLSTGGVEDVNAVFTAAHTGNFGTNDVVITLTAEFAAGWNYLRVLDPGNGDYELTSVSRGDVELNGRNFWQTDRFYVDGLGVTYEDRLHLLDYVETAGETTYTLTYTARDKNPLAVTDVSAIDSVLHEALDSITVTFNKAVNAATFTWEDLTLYRQGQLETNLIDSSITITQVNDKTFTIGGLASVTGDDGYYQLIVHTATITDTVGNAGELGKSITWTMAASSPAITSLTGIDELMNEMTDSVVIEFNTSINASTLTANLITVNGATATNVVITAINESNRQFRIDGLANYLAEGENSLTIDVTQVQSIAGVNGVASITENWSIDTTAPSAEDSTPLGCINEVPQSLVFTFSEAVSFDASALTLKRNGAAITADALSVAIDGDTATVTGIPAASADGDYELSLDMTQVTDAAGNAGTGTVSQVWTLDTVAPAQIPDLRLAAECDLGVSNNDGMTSTKALTLLGTLPEAGLNVSIYQQQGSTRTLLYHTTAESTELNASFNVSGGNSNLIVELTDTAGNRSESTLPVFVDEAVFSAEFAESFTEALENSPDSITVAFSEEVAGLTLADFTLLCDNEDISLASCILAQVDAKTWRLSGLPTSGNGDYTLSLNMSGLSKLSTGLAGSGTRELAWTVRQAVPPTVVLTSLNAGQVLDSLATFSITFSETMNCEELIESGAISQAVKIQRLDGNADVAETILLDATDFQYVAETNTLVWRGMEPLAEGGSYRVILDHALFRSAAGLALDGGTASDTAMTAFGSSQTMNVAGTAYAVPVWKDYNGDGKLDILVGEKADSTTGKIRLYLNTGTNALPAFNEYAYLQGGNGDWSVAASACLGIAFRFADTNNDGAEDLVYGTSDGRICVSVRNGSIYETGVALTAGGNAIDVGDRAVFDLYDWDGDGDLDIISGAMDGKVYLYVNNGDWSFATAQTLGIQVAEGRSTVSVADLNGDRLADIVSGDTQGSVFAILNNGDSTFSQVRLSDGVSQRSRPFTADANSDGVLDITVGYADGTVKVFYGEQGTTSTHAFRVNTAPVFSDEPQAVVDGYNVTISWSPATDDIGIEQYKVKVGETIYTTTDTSLELSSVDVGVYSYQVGVRDTYGLETWSAVDTFTVADITEPVLDGKPTLKQRKNTVTVSWNPAEDNVAVVGYRIELNGEVVANTTNLGYTLRGLELGDYTLRIGAYDAAGLVAWSETQAFTVTTLADNELHTLPYTMPTANYGVGCVSTSVGTLLGYYDLYGYCGYDVSNLIDGEITVNSRGDAEALLNTFIASNEYASRFFGKTPAEELDATFVAGTDNLNTAAWNSLADWLGTGQYWRGSADYATAYYLGTLAWVEETNETYTVSGRLLPARYADFKFGLSEFANSIGYSLDGDSTMSVKADTVTADGFSFGQLMDEIDAGRGVLLSLCSPDSLGHMVIAYGYNEATGEVIFDDTTASGRTMVWDGEYSYAGHTYTIQNATTVVFDTTNLRLFDKTPPEISSVEADVMAPTNGKVVVTAIATDEVNAVMLFYSKDGGDWQEYMDGVEFETNGSVLFKAVDAAGNETVSEEFKVGNIDKESPQVVEVSVAAPDVTGQAVVSLISSEELSQLQASWNGADWQAVDGQAFAVDGNGAVCFRLVDLAGNEIVTEAYTVDVFNTVMQEISVQSTGDGEGTFDWSGDATTGWAQRYDVVLTSKAGVIELLGVAADGVEFLNASAAEFFLAVKPAQSDVWTAMDESVVIQSGAAEHPVVLQAEENNLAELMFASGHGVWNDIYLARHVGVDGWMGTGETMPLSGRNVIDDLFAGSDDASILLLTDDTNGDALFVDDIYSVFPEGLDAQARIAKINEIRAGAGKDIVDLTSQRYDYVGGGMTVRGGAGDDVIWANKGDNWLFGDAGNDRLVGASGNDVIVGGSGDDALHGGGGDDIFAFGGEWGNDSVEQLATGKVTLWFKEGDETNVVWNAETSTLTYSAGNNSVTVTGVALENITLKFDDGSAQYSALQDAGAFDAFTSERIFEDKNCGLLAGNSVV